MRWLSACVSASSTTACSPHRGRRRALVSQPRRAPDRRRARGDLPDAAPVAAWQRPGRCRACGSSPWARAWRSTRHRGGAGSCRRSSSALGVLAHLRAAGAATTSCTRRRSPTSGCWRARCAAPAGFRLVVDWHELWTAAYWREYLGRAGGWAGWRVQRLRAHSPARVLLFAPARRAPARRGGARRGDGAGGHVRRGLRPCGRPAARRARGRVRGPPHPGEAGAGDRRARSQRARERAPELRAEIYGDGPERERCARAWPSWGSAPS